MYRSFSAHRFGVTYRILKQKYAQLLRFPTYCLTSLNLINMILKRIIQRYFLEGGSLTVQLEDD